MGGWIADRRWSFIVSLILVGTLLCPGWTTYGIAIADQKAEASAPQDEREGAASGEAAEYHTPLAGAIYHYFGQDFITPRKKENPVRFGYSTGYSSWINSSNSSIQLGF